VVVHGPIERVDDASLVHPMDVGATGESVVAELNVDNILDAFTNDVN